MGIVNSNRRPTRESTWSPSIIRMAGGFLLLVFLIIGGLTWLWPQDNLVLRIFFILIVSGLIFYIVRQINQLQKELAMSRQRIEEAESEAARTSRRSEAIFQLSQKFVEANDENEVLNPLLTVTVELVGAIGASVVPLDDRGQPLTAISHGEIPKALMDSWVEYLASPEIRHKCGTCQQTGSLVHTCPLVELPVFNHTDLSTPSNIYCLHLRRGEREFGILNLYLPEEKSLDSDTQDFLQTLLDETALVLESLQAQKRELIILQQIRHQADIQDLQLEFLENVKETLRADFVLLYIIGDHEPHQQNVRIGDYPESSGSLIEGALLVISDEPSFGVILAGRTHATKFSSRHLSLLQNLAGQLSLVVRNAELQAEIKFNSIMTERTRLAREIHDGIAQTLGFLKLQAAQMENYLAARDINRLQNSLSMTYKVLSDAYLDVRQAIDDLRISPGSEGLESWLRETSIEFEENTGLKVNLEGTPAAEKLPPEIQVQLIRIIQEALSNVRKHAQASEAWIEYDQVGEIFLVEIRDDGRGFHPDELPGVSKYGLQGMRERSDLIGADLMIISAPEEGTIIKVQVPVPTGESIS